MSENQFSHLAQYEVKGHTAEFTLPFIDNPAPTLTVVATGQANTVWFNAITERSAQSGVARKLAKEELYAVTVDGNRKQDRELFPQCVVVGWTGILGSGGQPVPFSVEACTEFLAALPDWIMDNLRNFVATPYNFLKENEPTAQEIEEQAGN